VRILSVQESTLGLRLKREMENLYQVQQRQRDRCKTVLKRNMEVVRSSKEARDMGPLTDENLEHALEQNISLFTDNVCHTRRYFYQKVIISIKII